jgi:hypothetical protein
LAPKKQLNVTLSILEGALEQKRVDIVRLTTTIRESKAQLEIAERQQGEIIAAIRVLPEALSADRRRQEEKDIE